MSGSTCIPGCIKSHSVFTIAELRETSFGLNALSRLFSAQSFVLSICVCNRKFAT